MASSNTLTFDQDTPRRPILDDVGGAAKENDASDPPNPVTDPTAEDWNQISKLAVAAGRVMPLAVIVVEFSSGTPLVTAALSASSVLTAADITATDEGTGDTRLTWLDGTLPGALAAVACSNDFAARLMSAVVDTGNVRVRSADDAGTLTDTNFTVVVF